MPETEQLRTAKETADQMRVSRATITRFVQQKKLQHYRIGDRLLFSDNHIRAYLASDECPARKKRNSLDRESD